MLRNGKGYADAVRSVTSQNTSTLESELAAIGETVGNATQGSRLSSTSLTSNDMTRSIPDRQERSDASSLEPREMPTSVDAPRTKDSSGMPVLTDGTRRNLASDARASEAAGDNPYIRDISAPVDRDGFHTVTRRGRAASVDSATSNGTSISGPKIFPKEFVEDTEARDEGAWVDIQPTINAAVSRMTQEEKARIDRREKALSRKRKERRAKARKVVTDEISSKKKDNTHRKIGDTGKDKRVDSSSPGPSYFEKGKFRAQDIQGTDADQVYRDRQVAEALQAAELEAEAARRGKPAKDSVPTKAKAVSPDKVDKKKRRREGLELTRFIQSPTPQARSEELETVAQPNRLPLKSPKRAVNQIPQGGYLWAAIGKDKPKKPSKNAKKKSKRDKYLNSRLDEESSSSSDDSSSSSESDPSSSDSSGSSTSSSSSSSPSSETSSESSPSDSSSSTSSSNSSSPDKRRRKRKSKSGQRRRKTKKSRTMKFPEPSAYNGRENLAEFEKFVFELKNYFGASKMSSYWQLRAMGKYLTDKAGQHYMAFAAVDPDKYSVDTYLRDLFNHCFPPHFRQKMREKFNKCVQGTRGTREYLRELRTLGNRLPDVGETQIRHRFWEGSASYIRLEWARAGLDPETSTLSQLEIAAERFESAERLRKSEESRANNSKGHERTRDRSEDRGRHDRRRRNRREVHRRKRSRDFARQDRKDRTENTKREDTEKPRDKFERNRKYNKGDKKRNKHSELTQEEMDELRAANKCFTCKNVGHMSKDCPQRNTTKRPTLGAVSFVDLEKIAEAERESRSLALGSMVWSDIADEDLTWMRPPPDETNEQIEIRTLMEKIRDKLESVVPLPGDEYADPPSIPGQRWIIQYHTRPMGSEFVITDTVMGWDRYHVPIEFMRNGIDFSEDLVETRWRNFVNALVNDDMVTHNIIEAFDEALNSPESGLLNETTLRRGNQQYWVRAETEPTGSKEFVIEDAFPDPGCRGVDDIYRISRSQMLGEGFNIVTFMHEEKWVRQRILNAICGKTYPSDDWSTNEPSIEPDSVERWMIQTLSPSAYHILDRRTGTTHLLRRSVAYDNSFDIERWMSDEQRNVHGERWDAIEVTSDSDSDEFWTATEGEHNEAEDESDYDERIIGHSRWAMETDEDESSPPQGSTPVPGPSPKPCDHMIDDDEMPDLAYVSGTSDLDEDEDDDVSRCSNFGDREPEEGRATQVPTGFDYAGSRRASPTNTRTDESGLEAFGDLRLGALSVEDRRERGPNRPRQATDSQMHPPHQSPRTSRSVHLNASSVKDKRPQKKKVLDRLERNSARTKDFTRLVPSALVVEVRINGQPARALIDSGSLADFMSTKLADQLRLRTEQLEKPMSVQLAVTGSRTVVNTSTTVEFELQGVREQRRFDIINLENYDIILGTPFLYQHKVGMAFNPSKIAIGSDTALPMEGEQIAIIPSRAADILEGELNKLRNALREEARDLCKGVGETNLPPLRAVNHEIPLIDPAKVYGWRPSKCPEAMRPLWNEKRDQYLKSGRWRFRTGNNASPMLILWKPKPGPDGTRRIRTVVDKREQNSNTKKMASPLPDMESMLRNASKHKYRSLMDGKDAYEQIRVVPEHVSRTLFNTPDGTMESLVLQQGDCNGGATYQSLMNHIFAPYIGVFMDVYLDDILVYSDTIEDHIKHIRIIFNVLRKEKLYLSPDKMDFFAKELNLLGHVVTDRGIRMDPHKVNTIMNWKVPTSKELLSGFLGSVGYLANGIAGVRVPMAVLTPLTGSDRSFRWGATEQRAFEQIKNLVHEHRNKHRVSIDYSKKAPWINLTCDASLTGAGGHLSQGDDLETAKNVAFWSGKFNSAQQNYPTHERELLAIIESLKRFKHLLLGAKFRIFSDHRSLQNLSKQKNLSPRQARWLEFLCEFDYEIHYLPGAQNRLSDALSRMYSEEPEGVRRAKSEFVSVEGDTTSGTALASLLVFRTTEPLYTGSSALPELCLVEPTEATTLRRSTRIRTAAKRDDHDYERLYPERFRKGRKKPPVLMEEVPDEDTTLNPPMEASSDLRDKANESGDAPDPIEAQTNVQPDENAPQRIQDNSMNDQTENPPVEYEQPSQTEQSPTEDEPNHRNVQAEPLPSLTASAEGIDIYGAIEGRYPEDPLFRDIVGDPSKFRNFEMEKGLLYLKDNGKRLLCIPDIKYGHRRIREVLITYAHSLLAHLGSRKTLQYLRDHVWWKGLPGDVEAYCGSCQVCSMTKSRTTKPFGMLKSLEVPSQPWQVISIDFVGPLPLSKNRHGSFDMVAVIIDHLTSMVHLAPCSQSYKAKDIAEMIFDVVYRHHGLPEIIVSDRDSYFTSTFYSELNRLIGVELRLSTAYHPQTDGATERANRTMTQMLRQCVSPNQKDWVAKLPGIEFAMNSARSDTTGFSPFFLNYGRVPDPMVWDKTTEYPGVRVFAQRIKDAIMSAHDSIIAARVKQTKEANKHRRAAPFAKGDLVYLSTENLSLPKRRARKLVPKFIGPYRITEEVSKGASYKLELPAELKQRGVHPVFHASLLRVHIPNDDRRFPGRNIRQLSAFEESPTEWDVDKILTHYGKGNDMLFKLKWKSGDETWTDLRTASKLEQLQQYCDLLGVPSSAQLPEGKTEPPEDIELHLGSAETHRYEEIKGNTRPAQRKAKSVVSRNPLIPLCSLPMQSSTTEPPVQWIQTKRHRYRADHIAEYRQHEFQTICNQIWQRTGYPERIVNLGPPPHDYQFWVNDPEGESITGYFAATALNAPKHIITRFHKTNVEVAEEGQGKTYSGGKQPRNRNWSSYPRHHPVTRSASAPATPPDPPSPSSSAVDTSSVESIATQAVQNALGAHLQHAMNAMMQQFVMQNQAHTGASPQLNALHVTGTPIPAAIQQPLPQDLAPITDILGPNPFGEDSDMSTQAQG